VGLGSQSGQEWKILPPLGFNTQTNWPKACCYTDYAIPDICRIYTDLLA